MAGLIELMKIFPDSVYFFINCWTWGYEDILKAIAREFQSQVMISPSPMAFTIMDFG